MSVRVLVNQNSLEDIAAAIREKNNSTNSYTPGEMGDAIRSITTGGGEGIGKMPELVDKSITEVRKEDLADITEIGVEAFYMCESLTYVELPDTVTYIRDNAFSQTISLVDFHMSKNIQELASFVFGGSNVRNIYFYGAPPYAQASTFDNIQSLENVYVPGEYYDDYVAAFGTTSLKDKFIPVGKYVSSFPEKVVIVAGESKQIGFTLYNFDTQPSVSITSTNNDIANSGGYGFYMPNGYVLINGSQEGTATLTYTIESEGSTFIREIEVTVVGELAESTYEVVPVAGAEYGFELNSDGYWESTNKGVDESYAMCRINISNQAGLPIWIDCINSAENNYDYGILSLVNTNLELSPAADVSGVYYSFRDNYNKDMEPIEYTLVGDGFIIVKFIKDGSGSQDNDSLQFSVTIG